MLQGPALIFQLCQPAFPEDSRAARVSCSELVGSEASICTGVTGTRGQDTVMACLPLPTTGTPVEVSATFYVTRAGQSVPGLSFPPHWLSLVNWVENGERKGFNPIFKVSRLVILFFKEEVLYTIKTCFCKPHSRKDELLTKGF